ncbi:MAG: dicarboxylate/amino acid:cation symporter [Chitinophagales bacterium]|nr:dicarboxylate/amino acid:cation symporter [Chitinophagales bacterium]
MGKLALHWKILIGMTTGVVFALVLGRFSWGSQWIADWIKPLGIVFINALKMIAIPLILGSLIKGISDLKDISKLSKMGFQTIGLYLITTVFAVCLGLVLVNIMQPGKAISEDTRNELINNYGGEVEAAQSHAQQQKNVSPLQPIVDIVPENIVNASSNNTNMLQIIFFALFFGVCIILIPEETARPVKTFFDGFNAVILKMVDVIMMAAPVGVFALLAGLIVDAPNKDLMAALLIYSVCILIGLSLMILLYNLLIWIFTGKSPRFFMKGMSSVQLLAFSTSSSAATLPLTMDRVERRLGVDNEVTSFVLPIGATVNMDGTSLYQAVAAVFIAQAFGMDLSLSTQMGIVVTATLASIGTAAIPSAGIVMLLIVLAQAGIPEAGLALILAVDRPLDMCRTVVNVSGDAAVSMLVAKSIGKLDEVSDE